MSFFCWLRQAVFRKTFCAFRLTADSILRLSLFLLVSRNCSGQFPLQSTILSPCTFSDVTQASGNALVPRSCQAAGQIALCFIENPLFITRYDVFEDGLFSCLHNFSESVVIEGSLPSCMLNVMKPFVTLLKPLESPFCCENSNRSFTKCIDVSRRFRSRFP